MFFWNEHVWMFQGNRFSITLKYETCYSAVQKIISFLLLNTSPHISAKCFSGLNIYRKDKGIFGCRPHTLFWPVISPNFQEILWQPGKCEFLICAMLLEITGIGEIVYAMLLKKIVKTLLTNYVNVEQPQLKSFAIWLKQKLTI